MNIPCTNFSSLLGFHTGLKPGFYVDRDDDIWCVKESGAEFLNADGERWVKSWEMTFFTHKEDLEFLGEL